MKLNFTFTNFKLNMNPEKNGVFSFHSNIDHIKKKKGLKIVNFEVYFVLIFGKKKKRN